MGEIADAMINGEFDFFTGEYIGRGCGYPRTLTKELPWEKRDFTQSKNIAFKGLSKYLLNRIKVTDITPIVNEYMPDPTRGLKSRCLTIQKNFPAFVQWINSKYPKVTKKPK